MFDKSTGTKIKQSLACICLSWCKLAVQNGNHDGISFASTGSTFPVMLYTNLSGQILERAKRLYDKVSCDYEKLPV